MERLCDKQAPLCFTCLTKESGLPLVVATSLLPDTAYYVFVRDKFGETYVTEITTEADSTIIINESNFPNLFAPYAGSFTIYISSDFSGSPRAQIIDPDNPDETYYCITYTNICE